MVLRGWARLRKSEVLKGQVGSSKGLVTKGGVLFRSGMAWLCYVQAKCSIDANRGVRELHSVLKFGGAMVR